LVLYTLLVLYKKFNLRSELELRPTVSQLSLPNKIKNRTHDK